jgi:hypothetical protein
MVEKFCQVLKTQNVLLTTEELGQGPEVVFWQQVGSWSLPDNLKGKYAIGSIIKIGKLCDDFQQLGKDAQLTVEFRKDFKVIPSTVIMGKKFEWSSIFFFKAAYQAFERLNGNSL